MKINSILILFFLLWSPWCFYAQIVPVENDSIVMEYTLIDGDSIPVNAIDLNEVMLLHRLKFDNSLERRRYVILRRKTIKVYPYATLAAERLESLNERLNSLESKRDKRVYARRIQKYIENEFSDELKKLTRTEGQILVKLVHRQTGITTFDLIKDLRNGWRAFWFNTTATLFNISLKEEFDPVNVKEDYYIEDILERSFQSGVLKRQEPAIQFDFYELSNKWLK
ncbi:DUF4294 domain-containing protein [Bizionia paragorgiae]|uniref:DUF4294 domain-containing protein n=1 Tax=Bizionia paragorgiae TaxID=283786 RepID=UPI00299D95BD|nr:DUF4294 domain-containing protein [Bizionia paragorgiae]MDX1272704.1 DUF4294 domain-containing protein [Bizionia paragorgiae]